MSDAIDLEAGGIGYVMDIEKIMTGMKRANREMTAAHESESIIVLGPTRAGKSTLVCMLSGKITMYKNNPDADKFISADTKREDLQISAKAQACTSFPARVETDSGEILWDTPGFGDNKGVEQELQNAYYIKRLMDSHRSVKTVFVVAIHQLEGAATAFLDGLTTVFKMFSSVDKFMTYLTLVVTGVDIGVEPKQMRDMLRRRILESTELQHEGIEQIREYCTLVVEGTCGLIVMHKPHFNSDQVGKKSVMKPNEFADFTQHFRAAIKNSKKISNLPKTNVVVTPEAQKLLDSSCDKQISALADSFRDLIQQVTDHESKVRLNRIEQTEASIVETLCLLDAFNLFQWLSAFQNKEHTLSLLTCAAKWMDPFKFSSDVLKAVRPVCSSISDEICMIVFFYGILDVSDNSTFPDKLFSELKPDMQKLEQFYNEQRSKIAQTASATLKLSLVDSTERKLKQFLDSTMDNAAALVADVKCELLTVAAQQDVKLLVRKLKETDILGADCLGKEAHTQFQQGLESAVAIVNAFHDPSQVRIDMEFTTMGEKLLQEYSTRSSSIQEVALTGRTDGGSLTGRVHAYQMGKDADLLQSENVQLKAQNLALQQQISSDCQLASVQQIRREKEVLIAQLDEERLSKAALDATTMEKDKTLEVLKEEKHNVEQMVAMQQSQADRSKKDNDELRQQIVELQKTIKSRRGWFCRPSKQSSRDVDL